MMKPETGIALSVSLVGFLLALAVANFLMGNHLLFGLNMGLFGFGVGVLWRWIELRKSFRRLEQLREQYRN